MKLILDTKKCFGCASCVSVFSNYFSMDYKTGKAKIIKAQKKGGLFILDLDPDLFEKLKEAPLSCPDGAIKIEK